MQIFYMADCHKSNWWLFLYYNNCITINVIVQQLYYKILQLQLYNNYITSYYIYYITKMLILCT